MYSVRAAVLVGLLAGAASAQPTYSGEVSRIVQAKCQGCHRPGDIAPFSLLSYNDAAARARSIRGMVAARLMPPWKPVKGHGSFRNDFSLSDEERQTILDWVDAGAPEGDPADLPEPLVFEGEWRLGQPDAIVSMPEPYVPVARDDAPDRYRCFILPDVVDADRWVKTVDVHPGRREAVHHVLLYLTDDPAQIRRARGFEEEDAEPGYDCWGGPRITPGAGPGLVKLAGGLLGGWVPGIHPLELPSDIGLLLPKGVTIIMQVHYNLGHSGDEEEMEEDAAPQADQTRIGLYFHPETPKSRLLMLPVLNDEFVLEPGVTGKQVDAIFNIDFAVAGLSIPEFLAPKLSAIRIAPHMHQLGKRISAELLRPNGNHESLIRIDEWDFHWQGFYDFAAPVPVPYRSRVKVACVYDNPTDREVRWGESTNDEMCLLYLGFTAEGPLAGIIFGNPQ